MPFFGSRLREAAATHLTAPLLSESAPPLSAGGSASEEAKDFSISLSRGKDGQGLGLVFDPSFVVSKLMPGCAAAHHGGVKVGDILLAVDGVVLQPGDSVRALFPTSEMSFPRGTSRKLLFTVIGAGLSFRNPNASGAAMVRVLVFERSAWNSVPSSKRKTSAVLT